MAICLINDVAYRFWSVYEYVYARRQQALTIILKDASPCPGYGGNKFLDNGPAKRTSQRVQGGLQVPLGYPPAHLRLSFTHIGETVKMLTGHVPSVETWRLAISTN